MKPEPTKRPYRILATCPCCGHTVRRDDLRYGAVHAIRVRMNWVKGLGRGRGFKHFWQELKPERGPQAILLMQVLRPLAGRLEEALAVTRAEMDQILSLHGVKASRGLRARQRHLPAARGLRSRQGHFLAAGGLRCTATLTEGFLDA